VFDLVHHLLGELVRRRIVDQRVVEGGVTVVAGAQNQIYPGRFGDARERDNAVVGASS